MQGPYDTMLRGCDALEGEISNQVVVTELNIVNLTRPGFPLKLLKTYTVSSYLRHAVSVQNSSGGILGCGRIETLSAVAASYQGETTFTQFSRYLPVVLSDSSNSQVRQYRILESVSCSSRAAIFDPWSPPGVQVGTRQTTDQFPVGDLPNRPLEYLLFLYEVPLIGNATIVGHVVREH